MTRPILFAFVAFGGLAACASYRPAPLSASSIAHAYALRTLDVEETQAEIRRIAPNAQWSTAAWDRLSLFATALRSNPAIAEARAHAVSAEAAARAAHNGPGITLSLTAEYAGNATESSPWLYGATSDVPLDIGPRRSSRIDSARSAAIVAHYDYAEAVWGTRMAIVGTLAENLLTAREIQIGDTLNQIHERQTAALQRRVEAGEALRLDLERSRADAAADARKADDARAKHASARAALAGAIGVTPTALAGVSFGWDNFDKPIGGMDVAAMRDDALLSRADILKAVAGYEQAEADLRLEVAKQWPELHVGPGYTWERGLVKLPFTLGLALPPLDLNRSALAAAEAHRLEAGLHLEAVIAAAQGAIEAALIERDAARSSLARVRDVDLQTARRAADQADQELAGGSIDRIDWAAQIGLRQSQLAEIEALRRVHAAEANIEDALRRPLDGSETLVAPQTRAAR
jgi:CRISPR system Cascade subunit CasA